jgi:hypothetical protein
MKSKSLLILCLSILLCSKVNSQTAEVLFINSNFGAGASSLDFEIRVMPQDTVYSVYQGINYLTSTQKITVPANTLLRLNFITTGTSTVYYTFNNAVYNPNEFRILFLAGSATSKAFSSYTGYNQASVGTKIRYSFRHSTPTLGQIDLMLRQTSQIIADDISYNSGVFGFTYEFNAADYILDVTPFNDNNNGLFAYQLPVASIAGEYIVLFTAGTGTALDMYMTRTNGTTVQLTPVAPLVGIDEMLLQNNLIKIFPNPSTGQFTIDNESNLDNLILVINDRLGRTIREIELNFASTNINITDVSNGLYSYQIIEKNGNLLKTGRLVKQ